MAALALAVLGAGAAAWLTLDGDDDRAPGDEARERSSSKTELSDYRNPSDTMSDLEPDTADTVTAQPQVAPSTAPPTPAAVAPVVPTPATRCWDGTPAASIAACTMPTGPRGLRHVFAGFDFAGELCDTVGRRDRPHYRRIFQCAQEGSVWFNFSEFDSQADGQAYYTDDAGSAGTPARDDLLQWRTFDGAEYKGALMSTGSPWGVTVYSTDPAVRDRVLSNLARRMVPQDRLRGHPVG